MLLQSKQLYFDGCFDSNKDEKVAEDFCIKNGLKKSMVRAESFDDGSKLIVVYDRRDPVTNEFRHIFL